MDRVWRRGRTLLHDPGWARGGYRQGAYHAIVGEAVYIERPDSYSIDPEAILVARIQPFLIYSNTAAEP